MIHFSVTGPMPEENCCAGGNVNTLEETPVLQQGKVTASCLEEEHYNPKR